jgi:hypothetical protein
MSRRGAGVLDDQRVVMLGHPGCGVVSRELYEIVVGGRIGASLSTALRGFELVAVDCDGSHFQGWVADQAVLLSAIDQVAALGLELRSVAPVSIAG